MNHEATTEPDAAARATEAPPAAVPPAVVHKSCGNCGAPLQGPFCYACGQPEKGMIRHLASVMSDVADTIFNVDSRIFRSIVPLYLRPGFLTNEYFAGRRTRYVTPFRLFFFLCVISFFTIQFSLDLGSQFNIVDGDGDSGIERAQTVDQVEQRMKEALDGLATARAAVGNSDKATRRLDRTEKKVRDQAAKRLDYLKARQEAISAGRAPPPDPADDDDATLVIDGTPWDPAAHPIDIAWLPAFANARLNAMAGQARQNIADARKHPGQAIGRLFSVLPQTLFVLMPLFALMLKIAYLFKRRLYMEHLMVALHSHAFIFLSLLVLVVLHHLTGWAETSAGVVLPLLKLLRAAAWTWIPVYLFLMAKRVYHQGWWMTTFKFCLVGFCYLFLISFGLAAAAIASLVA